MGKDVDTARFWSCTRRKMRQAQTYPIALAVTIQGHEIERVGPEKAFDLLPSAIWQHTIRIRSALRREVSHIFTWRNVVNIKTKIAFPAGTKKVFKNAVNFGAPAASILQRRLQDAVLCVDVHSWRSKVFLKWKQRIQQSLGLEDVDIPRIVQPVIPRLKTVSAQAQSSAPSRLWSIGIYRNGRMMLNSPLEAILPVVKKPPVFDLSSKISL